MKIPKHDVLAEQSLLGAMLIDDSIIPEVVSEITSEYFYESSHNYIFKAIALLNSEDIQVDLVTLKMQLEKLKVLDGVGGISYLTELTEAVPMSSSWRSYLDIIKEKHYLRGIAKISHSIADKVDKDIDPMEILNGMQDDIKKVISKVSKIETKTLSELLQNRYEELAEMVENGAARHKNTIRTGYKGLDSLLGDLHGGNLLILAARPGMGKTTVVLNITDYCIRQGKRVAFFSLEMSEQEITDKIIALYSKINAFKLRVGKVTEADLQEIAEAHEKISELKLEIDASPTLTPAMLKSKMLKMTMKDKVDLIVVDYLQLMKEPNEKNRVQEVSEISRQLKLVAKEFDVPLIALSQLSRNLESRPSKVPVMSDLRESGSLEQDADQIAFLYREEYYDEFTEKRNIIEVILKKNRHGSTGRVDLFFDKTKQRILNMTKQGVIMDSDGNAYNQTEQSKQMSM